MEIYFFKASNFKSLFIFLVFLGFFLSCQSLKRPEWVQLPPSDPDYFYGVGHSNLKNKTIDFELAQQKARVELAKSISVRVKSKEEVVYFKDNKGYEAQNYFQEIEESVIQHIEMVEIVNSWYTKRDGWWFLLRIPRHKWYGMVKRKKQELSSNLLSLIDYPGDSIQHLDNLATAWKQISESPYSDELYFTHSNGTPISMDAYLSEKTTAAIFKLGFSLEPTQVVQYFGRKCIVRCKYRQNGLKSDLAVKVVSSTSNRNAFRQFLKNKDLIDFNRLKWEDSFHSVDVVYGIGSPKLKDESKFVLASTKVESRQLPVKIVSTKKSKNTALIESVLLKKLPIVEVKKNGDPFLMFEISVLIVPNEKSKNGNPFFAEGTFSINGVSLDQTKRTLIYQTQVEKQAGPNREFVEAKIYQKAALQMGKDLPLLIDLISNQLASL